MILRSTKGGVLVALMVGALAVLVGASSVLAKGGADNVPAGAPAYAVRVTTADFATSTLAIGGYASINNFGGKESEQWVKFSWGDGQTEIVSASALPTYYKTSRSISIPGWSKSHVYANPSVSYTVTVIVYRGNAKGAEIYPTEKAVFTIVTENTKAVCTDAIDNDKDGKKDLADTDCAPFLEPETTLELCSDGIDNDNNGKVDLYDPSCVAFVPAEDTLETCSDGIDNNYNGKIDLFDDTCEAFRPDENTLELCRDGVDNDYDGKKDGVDSDCYPYNEPEDDEQTCTDGIDNDYNGFFDRQEGACTPFFIPSYVFFFN